MRAWNLQKSERTLDVNLHREPVETFRVGIGKKQDPTPAGSFKVRKVIGSRDWVPPRSRWAIGRKRTPSGHPDNPMKVAKIFFREPRSAASCKIAFENEHIFAARWSDLDSTGGTRLAATDMGGSHAS